MKEKDTYRILYENAPFVVMVLNEKGVVEEVNPALTAWLGYEASGFTGKSFEKLPGLLHFIDYSTIVENDATFYISFQHIDKQVKTGKVSKRNIYRNGIRTKTIMYIQDISELITEKHKQRLLKQFIVNIYNSSSKTIIILDDRNVIVKINDNAIRLLSRKRKEVLGQPISKFIPLNEEELSALRQNVMEPEHIESVVQKDKMEDTPVLIKISKIHNRGEVFSFLCILDITDRKNIENQLKKSEEKFRQLTENTDEAFWIAGENGTDHISYISPAYEKIWGLSPEYLYEHPEVWKESIYAEDREYVDIQLKRFFKKKRKLDIKYRITHRDGSLRWVWNKGFFIQKDSGRHRQAAGIIQDITLQQYMQDALLETTNKYKNLFELVSEAILIVHPQTFGIIDANKAACEMYQLECDELPGKRITDFAIHPGEMKKGLLPSSKKEEIRTYHKTGKGEIFPVSVLTTRIRIENNDYLLCSVRDISSQVENEKKILNAILKAEERERKRIAANIHDDIGPVLSGIMMYVNKIANENTSGSQKEQLKAYLEDMINKTIKHIKNISISLMPNLLSEFGLPKAINNFCRQINSLNDVRVNFYYNENFRLEEDLEINLYRILIELINNSLKHSGAKNIVIDLNKTESELRIDFRDDGKGFDFRKSLRKNTGLGLRNIVSRIHTIHGEYTFESVENKGIHFTIILKTNIKT